MKELFYENLKEKNIQQLHVLKSFYVEARKMDGEKTLYNKTIIIIRFGFCDIWNNQGRGKCYQPQPSASADNTNRDLDYSSNNCL